MGEISKTPEPYTCYATGNVQSAKEQGMEEIFSKGGYQKSVLVSCPVGSRS